MACVLLKLVSQRRLLYAGNQTFPTMGTKMISLAKLNRCTEERYKRDIVAVFLIYPNVLAPTVTCSDA